MTPPRGASFIKLFAGCAMSLQLHQPLAIQDEESLEFARQVVRAEAAALEMMAGRLDRTFLQAVKLLGNCSGDRPGRVAITGIGKSADIGQKIAGTLNSTGTRAFLLDATRALHGDLGMLHPRDVALILSHSGESEEIIRLLEPIQPLVGAVVALTGNPKSTLARKANLALVYGPLDEVCPLGLAPSASTTAMLALGDALAFTLSQSRDFSASDFAVFHPAGSLGRKLLLVEAVMRRGEELRIAPASNTVRMVFAQVRQTGRRTGAVMLTDPAGKLCGIFTDSDLARLIETRRDQALDHPISEVMTQNPQTILGGARLSEAVDLLRQHKISELPVVDDDQRPVGLIDITDLLGLISAEEREALDLPQRLRA